MPYIHTSVQLPRIDPATHATLISSVSEHEDHEVPPSTLSACANWEDVLHYIEKIHIYGISKSSFHVYIISFFLWGINLLFMGLEMNLKDFSVLRSEWWKPDRYCGLPSSQR